MVKFNAHLFSRLGESAAVFGLSLPSLKQNDDTICAISADMSVVAGLDRFKNQYPDSFFNVGIAEQNMLGMAAGLVSEGFRSIAVAQACFISMRSFEQMRQYMGYMEFPIICIGINSGLALTYFGNTHYAIEDLALTQAIPHLAVLSPADAGAAVELFELALHMSKPTYIRLSGGMNCPIVYSEKPKVKIGGYNVLRFGKHVTLIATGTMVAIALQVGDLLSVKGIEAKVIDAYCIKPLDVSIIDECKNCALIVSLEEHNVVGGLGSTIANLLAEVQFSPRFVKLGIQDTFLTVGDYMYLLEQAGLTPEQISKTILQELEK